MKHSCCLFLWNSSGLTCKKTQSHLGFLCTSTHGANLTHARVLISVLFLCCHFITWTPVPCVMYEKLQMKFYLEKYPWLANSHWWSFFLSWGGVLFLFMRERISYPVSQRPSQSISLHCAWSTEMFFQSVDFEFSLHQCFHLQQERSSAWFNFKAVGDSVSPKICRLCLGCTLIGGSVCIWCWDEK